jgi:hypothetical protein
MIHFVFPSDPLNPRRVDEHFAAQRSSLTDAAFSTSLVSDAVFEGRSVLREIPAGAVVVYRGWMVDAVQYRNFVSRVHEAGGLPLTSLNRYLAAHHLPNWYPKVRELTAETVIYSADVDLEAELGRLGWSAFFVKDYVKSLKTSAGSLISDPADSHRVLEEMRRFRGTIEGGICVRRVERFQPATETRYFVVRGRPFAAVSVDEIPAIICDVAKRIDSSFFSIDIAVTDAGETRVVEIGDGQVSDLVGWTVDDFLRMWRETL